MKTYVASPAASCVASSSPAACAARIAAVSASTQKPAVSTYYMWGYNGGAGVLGTRSAAPLVQVHPARVVWLADADHQGTQTASKVLTVS